MTCLPNNVLLLMKYGRQCGGPAPEWHVAISLNFAHRRWGAKNRSHNVQATKIPSRRAEIPLLRPFDIKMGPPPRQTWRQGANKSKVIAKPCQAFTEGHPLTSLVQKHYHPSSYMHTVLLLWKVWAVLLAKMLPPKQALARWQTWRGWHGCRKLRRYFVCSALHAIFLSPVQILRRQRHF